MLLHHLLQSAGRVHVVGGGELVHQEENVAVVKIAAKKMFFLTPMLF